MILFGVWGLARNEVASLERHVESDLTVQLRGDHVRVDVSSDLGPEALWGDAHAVTLSASGFSTDRLPLQVEPWRSRTGLIRNLRIRLSDFALRGLHVQSLDAEIPGCRFDFGLALHHNQLRLSKSGQGTGTVNVNQQDLERFALAKYRFLKSAHIVLDRDKVSVDGIADIGLAKVNFFVVSHLVAIGGSRLSLRDARVLVAGQPLQGSTLAQFLSKLDPIVDLDRDLGLEGAMTVREIHIGGGSLTLKGGVVVPSEGTPPNANS